jgi:type 1 glutamine amidotransferase
MGRVDVLLVVGGKYHDFDFARRELLGLLAEHEEFRVRVQPDYEDTSTLDATEVLVSYTCDVRPSEAAQERIRTWVAAGGRWVALHGTNSALGDAALRPVATPRIFPRWADLLGSQFISHPPIEPYRVSACSEHWLVAGVEPFDATDELYLCDYPDRAALQPLLDTTWQGTTPGFADSDWTTCDPQQLVSYLRPLGSGAVLYNTLGHCRSHYDMVPVKDYWPTIDRCSWDLPVFYELLRRALRWARGLDA